MEASEYIKTKLESGELSLVTIGDGAVLEMWDQALANVVDNCHDINAALKVKRQLVLKVILLPSADRTMLTYDVDVSTKLAGMDAVSGTADVCLDGGGRGVIAKQRGNPQLSLFDNVAPFKKKEEK